MEFTVDIQFLVNVGLGVFVAFIGFIVRRAIKLVDDVAEDIRRIEVDLPTIYSRKDEVKEGFTRLEQMLNRMFEKLDEKMDKR